MITKMRYGTLATWLLTAPIQADTTLRYAVQGECPANAESVEVSGSLMRIDVHTPEQKYSSIFDGTEDVFTTLLPEQHKYSQVEVDDDVVDYPADVADSDGTDTEHPVQKIQAMVQQQCAELEKHGGSCAATSDIHSMLQSVAATQPPPEIRDLGHKKTVDGVDCNVFEVLENGVKKREVCYALVSELPIPADDREGLGQGMQVVTHYDQSFGGMPGQLGAAGQEHFDESVEFPMAQTCFDSAGQSLGQATVDISQEKIAEDRFDIPAGYTKMTKQEIPSGN